MGTGPTGLVGNCIANELAWQGHIMPLFQKRREEKKEKKKERRPLACWHTCRQAKSAKNVVL